MFNKTITVNSVPDWETNYPPELVGQYLREQWSDLEQGQLIEMKPGMVVMTPQPSLHDFLIWCAKRQTKQEALKEGEDD